MQKHLEPKYSRPPSRANAKTLAMVAALFVLLSPYAADAVDLPVVGVATGDATRGPLVDYLQAIDAANVRVSGYEMVSPNEVAKEVDSRFGRSRNEAVPDTKSSLRSARAAISSGDPEEARRHVVDVLQATQKENRVVVGASEAWVEARLLLAEAALLPRNKRERKSGPADDQIEAAQKAVRPLFNEQPEFSSGDFEPTSELAAILDGVSKELRRTGTLTVKSPARGAGVYVNGVLVGKTPLEGYRLTAGTHEIQCGKPEKLGRIRQMEIGAGKDAEIVVDPNFEFELTTDGYAIVEAPPGQPAAVTSVQTGAGLATLYGSRYSLVFAVEGAGPVNLYAALVDAETNVAIRERSVEVPAGPVDTIALHRLLLFVAEGKEIDDSWRASRWIWVFGSVVSVATVSTGAYLLIDASSKIDDGTVDFGETQTEAQADLVKEGEDQQLIGIVVTTAGAIFVGVTIWALVSDLTYEEDEASLSQAGDWWLTAAPLLDGTGAVTSFGFTF